jgi:UDP-N-acetylglucosamine 4,6-dehydratase
MIYVVYGGTGSLGSAFIKSVFEQTPKHSVICVSRSEERQRLLWEKLGRPKRLFFVTGDVVEPSTTDAVIRKLRWVYPVGDYPRVNFVYAAAIKQVPYAELNVGVTTKVNILGCENALLAATDTRLRGWPVRFVTISTDKAVEPINVMGKTKAIQEDLVWSWPYLQGTVVRYGNVIGTTGSIIRVMQEKFSKKEPVQIYDATATRFVVSLSQAVESIHTGLGLLSSSLVIPKMGAANILTLVNMAARLLGIGGITEAALPRQGDKTHEKILSEYDRTRISEGRICLVGDLNQTHSNECLYSDEELENALRIGLNDAGIPIQ